MMFCYIVCTQRGEDATYRCYELVMQPYEHECYPCFDNQSKSHFNVSNGGIGLNSSRCSIYLYQIYLWQGPRLYLSIAS